MASRNESYFISRNEDDYNLPTEDAQIMSRYSTSIAADGTDEAKIYKITGGVEFIIRNSLSPKENGDFYKNYFETSMLSIQGLIGGEAYKLQCPFMSIAFTNYFKKMHISKTTNLPNKIFGKMDVSSMIWCPAEAVSEGMLRCRLIAAKNEKGKKLPSPIPLKSSMANLQNDTWQQFDPKQGQIPSKLLDECFSFEIQEQLQKQVAANKQLKQFATNKRSDIGTVVLLCGVWFKTVEDLNQHIESVHAKFNLVDFPQAHKVPTKPANTPASAPRNEAVRNNLRGGVMKIRGALQPTLEEYAKGKTYLKPTVNDSTEQVLDKMRVVLTRVNNDFSIFDENDQIMTDLYGDIVTLLHHFFEEDSNWIRMFDQSAQAISDNWNILGKNNTTKVSRDDILTWVKSMWDKRTTRTYLRQIYLSNRTSGATFSDDMSVQLNEAVRVVREIFGSSVEMRLPAKFRAGDEYKTATVNISYFLIVQKLIESWPNNDNKLWDLIKRLKLDKILVPRDETDEAAVLSTLSEGVQKLREKLRSAPSTNRPSNVKVNAIQDVELLSEMAEETLNDGYTPEHFTSYQEAVYRNWAEEFPESATKPTEKEFQILRRKNKVALDKDTEAGTCGRKRCNNKKACFNKRKKMQDEGKTLYITQHCIRSRKDDNKNDTKTADVKCVRSDKYVDISLKNQVLRLYEGEVNEIVHLTPKNDHTGFRAATPEETENEYIPTMPAQVRGVGLIGNTTNEILISLKPSAPVSNWAAIRQITVINTISELEEDIADINHGGTELPRHKKTRRSKQNRDHRYQDSSPEPVENINAVMNRFMESWEDEAVGRRVDLNSSLNEESELIEEDGVGAKNENEELTSIHEVTSDPTPASHNVLMVSIKSSEHPEQPRYDSKTGTELSTILDKTLSNENRKIYNKDARIGKCSRLECKLPKKCFQLREGKQQKNNLLYNSWNCLDIYEQSISLRLPHHEHLLSKQLAKIEEVDFKVFREDSEKSRCSRPKCGDRAACFEKRSLERFSSQRFYSNQPCYKYKKNARQMEPLRTTGTIPRWATWTDPRVATTSRNLTFDINPEELTWALHNSKPIEKELSTEADDGDLDNGLSEKHESAQSMMHGQQDKTKIEIREPDEPQKIFKMLATDVNNGDIDDGLFYEHETIERRMHRQQGKTENEIGSAEDVPNKSKISKEIQNCAIHSEEVFEGENENDPRGRKAPDHADQRKHFTSPMDGNPVDLQPPNQTKPQEFENYINWADEVDEETPLTQYNPWAVPRVHLNLTSVSPSGDRPEGGHPRCDRDTRNNQKSFREKSVTAGRSTKQQVDRVKIKLTMGPDQSPTKNNSRKVQLKPKRKFRKFGKSKNVTKNLGQAETGTFLRRTLSSCSEEGYSANDQMEFLEAENKSSIQSAEDYCRIFGYITAAEKLEKRPFTGDIQNKNLMGLMTQLSTEEYRRDAAGKKCSRPGCKKAKKCFAARRSRSYTIQPDELYSMLECYQPLKKVTKKMIARSDWKANNAPTCPPRPKKNNHGTY